MIASRTVATVAATSAVAMRRILAVGRISGAFGSTILVEVGGDGVKEVRRSPSAVESAAARPPAITSPVIAEGQAGDLRHRQHHEIRALDHEVRELHHPVPELVHHVEKAGGFHSVTHRGRSAICVSTSRV